jgi:nucleoside-diphosphate-sugar epimerase
MSDLHVIFGTGPVARATMHSLRRRDLPVRMVNRSGRYPAGDAPAGVEVLAGDARDEEFARRAAAGASVVYQCLNPEYHEWTELFPALQNGVLAAAESTGALLVSMENVYGYGRPDGSPLTEHSPLKAHTRKGRLRNGMAEQLREAHESGRVRVTTGRASDYFGPGGGMASPFGDLVFDAVLAGGTARLYGSPDFVHSYTFIPDIGEGLAVLGTDPRAVGRVWHLPNDPHPQTSRQMAQTAFRLAGTTGKIAGTPTWIFRLLGLRDRTIREVVEMAYEFETDFIVDSTAIAAELDVHPTPIDEAIAMTLASYR